MPKVLVVLCHPNPKSYTRAVCDAVLAGLADAGASVRLVDLHAEGFDPVLVVDEEHRRRDLDRVPYTAPHREALAWCDAIVFVFPMWWGGFPAMLKGFIDRVFVSGVAYTFRGRPKDAVLPTGLLRDKEAHFFYTLDAPALVALLDPGWLSSYLAIFRYCGFRVIRRSYLARLKLTSQAERERWLEHVRRTARAIGAG
jgi:NAD(P)H dehydrogenase (quinone)